MEYFSNLGPGAGFFPFWLGLLLAALSTIWLIQSSIGPREPLQKDFIPSGEGALRVLAVIVALVAFAWVVEGLGFQLTMLVFLAILLTALGRQKPIVTGVVAVAGSFGVYHIFTQWLDVALPKSSIDLLRNLGL
jgi:putative tricarboxylic transport membrane protein